MKVVVPRGWVPELPHRPSNRAMLSWLREPGSLTARLRTVCREFHVLCLRQGLLPVSTDESGALGVVSGELVWSRDVLLLLDGQPGVFAHTVMPRVPRHPFDRRFAQLGTRSLGGLLFSDPCVSRGGLEYRCLDGRHGLYQHAVAATGCREPRLWARRSLFGQGVKGVLVSEVFLPVVAVLEKVPVGHSQAFT